MITSNITASYLPIGLTVPFVDGSNGYFQQSFDTDTQIKMNLMNFLKTRRGERRMMPDFGTRLYEVIFEQDTTNLNEIIKDIISNEISEWIPQVSIQNIDVTNIQNPIGEDNYKKMVAVMYMNNQTKQFDTLTVQLENLQI